MQDLNPEIFKTPNLGTGASEDRDRIHFPQLRAARRQRVLDEMDRRGLDVCLFGREGNVRYVSGARRLWTAQARPFGPGCVVVRETGAVHLMTFSASYEGIPEEVGTDEFFCLTWNPMNYIDGMKSMAGVPNAKRVGVDGMSPFFQGLLPMAFPDATLVGAEDMMRDLRRHKLPEEVTALRISAALAESALYEAAREIQPGVSEKHLQAVYLERMCQLGTSQFAQQGTFTVIDPGGGLRWTTEERLLDEGSLVALAGGALWAGYEGSLARTWYCGRQTKPTAEHRALHGRWRNVIDRVIDACRPGATGADLRAAHEAAGEPLPAMTIASSLGLGHEGPVAGTALGATFDATQPIDAGMVLAVRTFVPGPAGGYLGEDMIHVAADGPEPITTLGAGPLGR